MNDTSRIALASLEVDSSIGNLYLEAGMLVVLAAVLYIGKKLIDKYFKEKK